MIDNDIHALIRNHEHDDPADTATAVMDAVCFPGWLRDLFFPLLRDECRRQARSASRIAERSIAPSQTWSDTQSSSARGEWLACRFYTGKDYVTWADATEKDHKGRIAFQGHLIGGIQHDIDNHVWAINTITKYGVRCLGEIDPAVLEQEDET